MSIRSSATCSLDARLADGRAPAVALRDATADDEPFLFRVYADSRREELARVPWTEAQRLAFLASQFDAQYRYYREHYDGATYHVVLADAEPVGRLFVARWPDEIRIMDIALVTEHRGIGIGSRVLGALCAEADATGAPMGIHVEKLNRARHLYARLGFDQRDDRGVYWYLVRPPRRVS
jgi:ribosomal protein S18 acetylase RimI-like enzyme